MKFNPENLKIITPPHLASPSRYSFERKMIELLCINLSGVQLENVLDLGCGWGEYRFLFHGIKYTGIDICDFSFSSKSEKNISFYIADAKKIPIDDSSIDLALCGFALEYIHPPESIILETKRIMKKGGLCLFTVPTAWVKAYEFPAFLLRVFGRKIYLSGGPEERYFTKSQLTYLFQGNGLKFVKFLPSAGFFIFLLKLIYVYYRCFRAFISWITRNKNIAVLSARRVGIAKNMHEFKQIYSEQVKNVNIFNMFYVYLIKLAMFLDTKFLPNFGTEWMILAKKDY